MAENPSKLLDAKLPARPSSRRPRLGLIVHRLALVAAALAIWWLSSLSRAALRIARPGTGLGRASAHHRQRRSVEQSRHHALAGYRRFCACRADRTAVGHPARGEQARRRIFRTGPAGLNTVSSAIWAIFAIIWFGISNATTIFVVFMTAMPLIITNVWQGTRAVNAEFIELAQVLRMPQWKVMTKIYLPTILPLLLFRRAARVRFRLARVVGRRNHRFFQRRRISPPASGRLDPNRPGLRLDFDPGDHDGDDRNGYDEAAGKLSVPLEKRMRTLNDRGSPLTNKSSLP